VADEGRRAVPALLRHGQRRTYLVHRLSRHAVCVRGGATATVLSVIDPLDANADPVAAMTAIAGRDRAWLSRLEDAAQAEGAAVDPQSSDGVLGRFGTSAGLFVLREGASERYARELQVRVARDGALVDERNRPILGFLSGAPMQAPAPLRVQSLSSKKFDRYELDERGVLYGVRAATAQSLEPVRTEVARLCLAFFPAPQRLTEDEGGDLRAGPAAGKPRFVASDSANVSQLERQPSADRLARFLESARQMYAASSRAELDVGLANAQDALVRVALDTVK
jgi:hypothetical protein